MNGHELLAPIIGGGAGFMAMIRWVQGGLSKKVSTDLCNERHLHIREDIVETRARVESLDGKLDTQNLVLTTIAASIKVIEGRSYKTRQGE